MLNEMSVWLVVVALGQVLNQDATIPFQRAVQNHRGNNSKMPCCQPYLAVKLSVFLDFPSDRSIFSTFVGGYKNTAIAERKNQKSSWIVRKRLTRWYVSVFAIKISFKFMNQIGDAVRSKLQRTTVSASAATWTFLPKTNSSLCVSPETQNSFKHTFSLWGETKSETPRCP